MIFIDLKKAYDKVPRNVMWWALQKHKVSSKYITLIKDMYDNVVTNTMTNTVIFEKNVLKIMIHFYMTHGKICCLVLDKFDCMLSKMCIYGREVQQLEKET
jgi:hypothetical protein